ncbi:PLP-dependent transferase [Halosimplex aquaticum]
MRTLTPRSRLRDRGFTLAESLGGVESLLAHPESMTNVSTSRKEWEAKGITDGLIRLSVGLEDVRDLQSDLEQALAVV